MTTLALVGGMLPLWLGTGPGAEERRAIAVVVIGGQTLSLLLTLLVTPVAYLWLDDLARLLSGRRRADATGPAAARHEPAAAAAPALAVAGDGSGARNGPPRHGEPGRPDGHGDRVPAAPRGLEAPSP